MTIYFSPGTRGLYDTDIVSYGINLPGDAIEISEGEYKTLLNGIANGGELDTNSDGKPYIISQGEYSPCTWSYFKQTKIDTLKSGAINNTGDINCDGDVQCYDLFAKDFVSAPTVCINGTDITTIFGSSLSTSDNKRITLRSHSNAGLSNFDPAATIANILQGKGHGSTTIYGKVGAIGFFIYKSTDGAVCLPGTIVAGTALKYVEFDATQMSLLKVVPSGGNEPLAASGSWALLNSADQYGGNVNDHLVLAVRVA